MRSLIFLIFLTILQYSQENTCVEVSFLRLFSSEHCKILRTPLATASKFPRGSKTKIFPDDEITSGFAIL